MTLWTLLDAVEQNAKHPTTFHLPHDEDLANLADGDFVKVAFQDEDGDNGERMWVQITEVNDEEDYILATLANHPVVWDDELSFDDGVVIQKNNILDVAPRRVMEQRKEAS